MQVEIIGHVFPDIVANYLPRLLANVIQSHTAVIDIGEYDVDSNRWVWDSIAFVLGDYNKLENRQRSSKGLDSNHIADEIYNKYSQQGKIISKDIMRSVARDISNGKLDFRFQELISNNLR